MGGKTKFTSDFVKLGGCPSVWFDDNDAGNEECYEETASTEKTASLQKNYQFDGVYPRQYAFDLDNLITKNFKSNAGKNFANKRLSPYMHNITIRLERFYTKFNCGQISPYQKRKAIVKMTCDELKSFIHDVNNWNQSLLGPCKQNL